MGDPRAATPADRDAVERLLARTYPAQMAQAYEAGALAAALPVMLRASPALLASGRFGVIDGAGGELSACGGWSIERPGSGDIAPGLGHIRHFATDPAQARRGLGRRLCDWCAKAARAEAIDAFACYASLNAEPFYSAIGFKRIGESAIAIGPCAAFPVIVMRAAL